jgi:prepilin-type processing-associated H-X9-DG protein
MNRQRISARSGFTAWDLLAVVLVLGVVAAMGCPAMVANREVARRIACTNQLKQIGLALHNYATANKVLPPGTVTGSAALGGQDFVLGSTSIWGPSGEAFPAANGRHGTSWILRILPYIEGAHIFPRWNWNTNVGGATVSQINGAFYSNSPISAASNGSSATNPIGLAGLDIEGLYCPSRRSQVRPGVDDIEPTTGTNLLPNVAVVWTGGGTDYGGCVGRHYAYDTAAATHIPKDAGLSANIVFNPGWIVVNTVYQVPSEGTSATALSGGAAPRWGIFGQINVSTSWAAIKDGASTTIMTGELQRIASIPAGGSLVLLSHDGWAVGGDATGFTTGFGGPNVVFGSPPAPVGMMNNGMFQSPGSEHYKGANYGFADGSVTFMSTSVDPNVFALLGSMADVTGVTPPN